MKEKTDRVRSGYSSGKQWNRDVLQTLIDLLNFPDRLREKEKGKLDVRIVYQWQLG